MSPSPPLRIAIAGAGIAGLTAAIALRKSYPDASQIQITIFEQAPQLKEIGASIGLNPSGLRILDKLGVDAALDDEIAFRQPSGWPMIYRHWATNEELGHDLHADVKDERHVMARYHRARLQRALVEALPGGVEVRLGVSVKGVKINDDGVVVGFEDGNSVEADLLIGADGIHSKVRRTFVPDHELKWTGLVAFRSAFDVALVKGIDGLPDDAVFWIGHERTLFASRLGKDQYTIVGSYSCNTDNTAAHYRDAKWDEPGDVKVLQEYYKGWHPVVEAIVNAVPYTRLYPNVAGASLDHFTFQGRVALLGDAAHTHGGAFAAGGSLAINDAYALVLALSHVWPPGSTSRPDAGQLGRALSLYEKTRKPLVDRLLAMVHGAAQKKRWAGSGKQETDEELRKRIAARPDMVWLTEHDVDAAFQNVVRDEAVDN